jgi:hypothetical protein
MIAINMHMSIFSLQVGGCRSNPLAINAHARRAVAVRDVPASATVPDGRTSDDCQCAMQIPRAGQQTESTLQKVLLSYCRRPSPLLMVPVHRSA